MLNGYPQLYPIPVSSWQKSKNNWLIQFLGGVISGIVAPACNRIYFKSIPIESDVSDNYDLSMATRVCGLVPLPLFIWTTLVLARKGTVATVGFLSIFLAAVNTQVLIV